MKNKLSILAGLLIVLVLSCNNPKTGSNKTTLQKRSDTPKKSDLVQAQSPGNNNSPQTLTLKEYQKSIEKKHQVFKISNTKDEVLKCSGGLVIKLNANSFEFADGKGTEPAVVKIDVKECSKTSDMILADLSTTADKKLLETGGMLLIDATSGNKKLKLKDNTSLKVMFPVKDDNKDMKIFNGSRGPKGDVVWKLAKQPDNLNKTRLYLHPDVQAGSADIKTFLRKNIGYPKPAIEKEVQGFVFIGCIVTEKGKIEDPSVLQGIGFGCDEEALRVVTLLPALIPARQKGKSVKSLCAIPVEFVLPGRDPDYNMKPDLTNKLVKKYADYTDRIITENNKEELGYYVFNSNQLGWINCDRFYDVEDKTILIVKQKPADDLQVKIVFNSIKSIMNGAPGKEFYTFSDIPIGEEITIIGLKIQDNQPMLAYKKAKITKDMAVDLDFKTITTQELKSKLEAL